MTHHVTPLPAEPGKERRMSEWMWEWEGYDPAGEQLREALCTLGNGYFATRGRCPSPGPGSCTVRGPTWPGATTG